VWLAGRRDLDASIAPDRTTARPHTRLLGSPLGLGARLVRPTVLAWVAGVAVLALILASETNAATKSLEESTGAKEVLSRLGGSGAAVAAYLGVCFFILAVVVALAAIGHVTAARHEEALGRLDHLVVRPVSRARWLCGRLVIAAGCIVATALVAGLCVWAAAAGQHTGVSGGSLIEAAANIVPPALCFLGLGTLVFGVAPRLTSGAAYGFLAWSFLVELIGGILRSNGWVLDSSPFHQMSAAPAVPPDWVSAGAMVAVGVVAAALGVAALAHRDLASE
jgi:ABC-2 type transport system permease protein